MTTTDPTGLVPDSELRALRDLADNGKLDCACDGSPELCVCSSVIMVCDELSALRSPTVGEVDAGQRVDAMAAMLLERDEGDCQQGWGAKFIAKNGASEHEGDCKYADRRVSGNCARCVVDVAREDARKIASLAPASREVDAGQFAAGWVACKEAALEAASNRNWTIVLKTEEETDAALSGSDVAQSCIAGAILTLEPPASAWMPIDENTPRDGTPILLSFFYFPINRHRRYIAMWNTDLGKWARDESGSYIFPDHMQVWFSHWMPMPLPLPSPPSDQAGER